jgi:hypothetical protein
MAYADLQTISLVGRIANLTVIKTEDERDCLVVTLYHRISQDVVVTIKFLNSNGLLTAYTNDNLVVGQELTVSGKIQGIRAFYMKDEELMPLKQPEWQLKVTDYAFGSKPQPKAEEPKSKVTDKKKTGVEPTLEPVDF